MKKYDGFQKSGTFRLTPETVVSGELRLDGESSFISLYSDKHFDAFPVRNRSILGVFHDKKKVSLINCTTLTGTGSGSRQGERYHFATLFPHFALFGDEHIEHSDKKIVSLHVLVDDAATLFYDFDAFGLMHDPTTLIEQVANSFPERERKIETGNEPIIQYFAGRREIFRARTAIGEVSATHNPRYSFPSPSGMRIENAITINLEFPEKVSLDDAIYGFLRSLVFFETIVGRPQNVLSAYVRIHSDTEHPIYLDVYWCMPPKRKTKSKERLPHPAENLIDAARAPESFASVLSAWLERDANWRHARYQFSESFRCQNQYSTERLVSIANAFDILPKSALGQLSPVAADLAEACEKSREIFRSLPQSPERDAVLNALGRIGEHNLRTKVKHRAARVAEALPNRLPDLDLVIHEAINCRNFFVHGTTRKNISAETLFKFVSFFTDALEFIFESSDLIDAGWDISEWISRGSTLSHPFWNFLHSYRPALAELKQIFPISHR